MQINKCFQHALLAWRWHELCHYLADENGFVVTQDDDDRLVFAQKAASASAGSTGASASDSTIKILSMLAPSDLLVEKVMSTSTITGMAPCW